MMKTLHRTVTTARSSRGEDLRVATRAVMTALALVVASASLIRAAARSQTELQRH